MKLVHPFLLKWRICRVKWRFTWKLIFLFLEIKRCEFDVPSLFLCYWNELWLACPISYGKGNLVSGSVIIASRWQDIFYTYIHMCRNLFPVTVPYRSESLYSFRKNKDVCKKMKTSDKKNKTFHSKDLYLSIFSLSLSGSTGLSFSSEREGCWM